MSKYAGTWKEELLIERFNRLSEYNQAKLLEYAQKITRTPLHDMSDIVRWLTGLDLIKVLSKMEEFGGLPKGSLTHYVIERVELNEITIKRRRRR